MTTRKQNQGQYCGTLAFIALNCALGVLFVVVFAVLVLLAGMVGLL